MRVEDLMPFICSQSVVSKKAISRFVGDEQEYVHKDEYVEYYFRRSDRPLFWTVGHGFVSGDHIKCASTIIDEDDLVVMDKYDGDYPLEYPIGNLILADDVDFDKIHELLAKFEEEKERKYNVGS